MKKAPFLFAFVLCPVLSLAPAIAQEPQVSGVQLLSISALDGEASEEMQSRMAEGAASFSFASPSGSFSMSNMLGRVDPNNSSQLFDLLANESVRKELMLSDAQYEGVQLIQNEAQNRLQSAIQEMMTQRKGGGNAIRLNANGFREIREANQADAEAAIEEILLPQQLERMRQLAYQVEVSNTGLGKALVDGRLGEEIGVYDKQKEELLRQAEKIDAEMRAAIVRIKAEARKKVFAKLAPDQRKKAEELLGKYFEYEEVSLQQQIRKSINGMRQAAEQDSEEPEPRRRRSNR